MRARRTSYEELVSQRGGSDEYRQAGPRPSAATCWAAPSASGAWALGLSQIELATRAGMTQPGQSRLEPGGVIPTIRLLDGISAALVADLIVEIAPHAA